MVFFRIKAFFERYPKPGSEETQGVLTFLSLPGSMETLGVIKPATLGA
jgi:hypothetical protein